MSEQVSCARVITRRSRTSGLGPFAARFEWLRGRAAMLAGIHTVTSVFVALLGADICVQALLQGRPLQALARLIALVRDLAGRLGVLEFLTLRTRQQRASAYHDRQADQWVCQADLRCRRWELKGLL